MDALAAAGPLTPKRVLPWHKTMAARKRRREELTASGELPVFAVLPADVARRLAQWRDPPHSLTLREVLSRAILQLAAGDPVALLDEEAQRAVDRICADWPLLPKDALSVAVRWLEWHLKTTDAQTLEFGE